MACKLDSWSRRRRVVGKAEHNQDGANPRFVVTSLARSRYAARASGCPNKIEFEMRTLRHLRRIRATAKRQHLASGAPARVFRDFR
jgi:hypothetical protein